MAKKIISISTAFLIAITLSIGLTIPAPALAATAPALGATNTYGIVSSTFTNSLNTASQTAIVGDVCYTTGPATAPVSITGATVTPCANGADQANALSSLNSQSCTSLGTNVVLSGTYTPGCYSSSGSMDIALSSTVTLSGAGVYIFKSGGALTTGANSVIALTNGATASNVFWAPVGAATIGANANSTSIPTFVGTIIDDAGVTLGHFANILGRVLSFGGTVTTDSNTITVPPAVVASGPVFIDANVNNILDSGEQYFNTIQSAINAASPGNTIVVTSGTYTETVNDTKGVTLRASGAAAIVGQVTLNAANAKIYGFNITNPNGNIGILINGFGNTEVSNNTVHHIGTGGVGGSISGIRFQDIDLAGADSIKILNNTISNIGTILNGSNKGISIEDSVGNSNLTGVMIVGNIISNIAANTTPIAPGKGAYGIMLSHASHSLSSNMGSTLGAQVTGNTISNLNGRWAHGIGLEGSTPNAVVTGNIMRNFTVSSVPADAAAIVFQDNDGESSTIIHNNNLDLTSIYFGLMNLVPLLTADATHNYWGTPTVDAAKFYGLTSYDPWYTDSGMTTLSSVTSGATITVATGTLTPLETSDGAVTLPAGTSNVVLGNDSVIDVATSSNVVSGGTVIVAGTSKTLANFTSGNLSGVDISTPKSIGGQSVTVGRAVRLSSGLSGVPIILTNSILSSASVSIPDTTTILAPSGWNGIIAPPKTGSSAGDSAPSGFSVGSTVIDVGSPTAVLLFDKPVQITLNGISGSVGYKPAGLNTWTRISTVCGGTYDTPTLSSASFPGECSITNGADTKILTYHLTTFGGLNSTIATLHVIKLVVNGSGGTGPGVLHDSDFLIHVRNAGVDVSAPQPGAAAPGTIYSLSAGTYTVNEDINNSYVKSYSNVGGCDQNGSVTLAEGENKTCTVVNTDIPLPTPVNTSSRVIGGNYNPPIIVPSIGIMKASSPLNLPGGPGYVTYNYIIWNVVGQKALTDITVTDDKCGPVTYLSGDLNGNKKLDGDEKWNYRCIAALSKTTTNTATVTGYSDDPYHQASVAAISATVVVGGSTSTPLISIVKVPNQLTPFAFGGGNVIYTYAVTNPGVSPVNNVKVSDDKCTQVIRTSGDSNSNNLLDPSETWIYTCQANVSVSTRSIAMAEGRANGFYAIGYGFATVLVSSPLFPETGALQSYGENIKMINANLVKGIYGSDVKILQEFLIEQGVGEAAQALKVNGSTLYFGPLTKAALAEWQKSVGIYPPIGNFGPITRAYLKAR